MISAPPWTCVNSCVTVLMGFNSAFRVLSKFCSSQKYFLYWQTLLEIFVVCTSHAKVWTLCPQCFEWLNLPFLALHNMMYLSKASKWCCRKLCLQRTCLFGWNVAMMKDICWDRWNLEFQAARSNSESVICNSAYLYCTSHASQALQFWECQFSLSVFLSAGYLCLGSDGHIASVGPAVLADVCIESCLVVPWICASGATTYSWRLC